MGAWDPKTPSRTHPPSSANILDKEENYLSHILMKTDKNFILPFFFIEEKAQLLFCL